MKAHAFALQVFLFTAAAALAAPAPAPASLLNEAVRNWIAGRDDWALTQRVRELDDNGKVQQERLERYDPSVPDNRRWKLLELNGAPPPEAERQKWEKWKNGRPRKNSAKPPGEYLDLDRATVVEETPKAVTYAVSLRPAAARLIQVEKLAIRVTISRESRMVERVTVDLREPMRVALGLARITDIDLDVRFDPSAGDTAAATKDVETSGTARAEVSVLGDRVEYEWTDFKRVTAYRAPGKK